MLHSHIHTRFGTIKIHFGQELSGYVSSDRTPAQSRKEPDRNTERYRYYSRQCCFDTTLLEWL